MSNDEPQYWTITYRLWPTQETDLGRHTDRGVYQGNTPLEALNDLLYSVRGRKGLYELARVDEVDGPFESKERARDAWHADGENDE